MQAAENLSRRDCDNRARIFHRLPIPVPVLLCVVFLVGACADEQRRDGEEAACNLRFVDKDLVQVDHLQVARWDFGYGAGVSPATVRNDASPNNFIDLDPERFQVDLTFPAGNQNQQQVETVQVQIETLAGADSDGLTAQDAVETGPNTGVFRTRAQLLMSPDLPPGDNPDDGFAAHDGVAGAVADEAPNDRTHKTNIDGDVRAFFQRGAARCEVKKPVCNRTPEERRLANIRIWVFREPFTDRNGNGQFDFTDANGNNQHDPGEASEPFRDISLDRARGPVETNAKIMAEVDRATLAWAQACIKMNVVAGPTVVDAPRDPRGNNILQDGVFSFGVPNARDDDAFLVVNQFMAITGAQPNPKIAEVFFTGALAGSLLGLTRPPAIAGIGPFPANYDRVYIFIAAGNPLQFRTLAHEMGHALTNELDARKPDYIFFPYELRAGQIVPPADDAVTRQRRITAGTATTARTDRPVGPGPTAGNSILSTP